MKYIPIAAFFLIFFAGCFSDCRFNKIPAVKNFDIARYMGKWYEFRRLPNRFERGMTEVTAEYTLLPDGTVKVLNSGIRNGKKKSVSGKARLVRNDRTGELQVSFFPLIYSPYRIIKLAPDYRYSVVIGSKPSMLWILSRTRELAAQDQAEIRLFLEKYGFRLKNLTSSR